ncbi:MAG: hypothetical protein J7K00_00885 [Candidatus Diapherotrites archaeon]|nr:hypothetical protein [Candidatus Diapherotrites archaeon]
MFNAKIKGTVFISILSIAIFIGCISSENNFSEKNESWKTENGNLDFNWLALALESPEPSKHCDSIIVENAKSSRYKGFCYLLSAEVTNNRSNCLKIKSEPTIRNNCLHSLDNYHGINRCSAETIPAPSDMECAVTHAVSQNNPEVCDSLGDERDNCIYYYSVISGNAGSCNAVSDKNLKDKCNYHLGLDRQDKNFCALINDQSVASSCYAAVARFLFSNTDSTNKDNQSDMTQYCDSINDQGIKDNCYQTLAKRKYNADLCNYISDQNLKDDCIIELVSGRINDESLCDRMSTSHKKEICLSRLYSRVNPTLCESLTIDKIKWDCFTGGAIRQKDITICKMIDQTDIQKGCEEDYSNRY